MEFTTQIEKFLLLPPCPHKKYLLIELGLLYCLCLLNKDRCESQGKKNIHVIGSPEYLVGFSIRNLKNVGKDFTRTMEKALIISGHYSRGINAEFYGWTRIISCTNTGWKTSGWWHFCLKQSMRYTESQAKHESTLSCCCEKKRTPHWAL